MFAVLFIRSFGLHAILRGRTTTEQMAPLALLDSAATATSSKQRGKAPILELSAAAEAAGVRVGMTASQALARCSRLTLIQKNPPAEAAAQDELLAHAARFTPDYENSAPGVVTLDLRHLAGNGMLARDSRPHALRLQAPLRDTFPHHLRIGVASAPDLALLAAHLAPAPDFFCFIAPETTVAHAFLAPLPVSVLRSLVDDPESFKLLHQWGVRTLGQLAALPRHELVRRVGPKGGALWDGATGQSHRLLRLVRPPIDYTLEREFEHPVESLDPLLLVLRQFLETLCARLASSWLVARAMQLRLQFDSGSVHERELRIAEPCADVDLLLRLLQTHLDGFTADAPITRASLELLPTRPGQYQKQLFENNLRDANALAETLSQLETLLGKERVGTPHLLPTRHPDGFVLRPFLESAAAEPQTGAQSGSLRRVGASSPSAAGKVPARDLWRSLPLPPVRRFRPPLPARIKLSEGRPAEVDAGHIRGPIRRVEGPWPLSGEWWDTTRGWEWQEWDIWLETGAYRLVQHSSSAWEVVAAVG